MDYKKNIGLTLVEIAILLIIIGIIIGASFKLGPLLFSSKQTKAISWINSWISELERYNGSAVNPPPDSYQAPNETLYIKYGSYTTSTYKTNIIAICNSSNCNTNLSDDTKILARMLERQYNDKVGAGLGTVRGADSISVSGQNISSITVNSTDTNWSGNYKAIVIFYEKINTNF